MNKLLLLFILFFVLKAAGQCPPNIGFENGNFDNWQCFAGTVDQSGNLDIPLTGPVYGRHTMYDKSVPAGVDEYGGFPKQCPNGSNFSIQLGNSDVPSKAERISYTFVVPAGQSDYTIFYNYAIVLQDPAPGGTVHTTPQKPLFSAEIYDVESNQYITCASFSYNAGSSLPGFTQSPLFNSKGIVYYKGWTPASINLRGYGGRTVRLEFTARCCTPGGHFGYAYLDVNNGCSSAITGNEYCTGQKGLTLYAPAGFNQYFWYNADFSKLLGTDYVLTINPAPTDQTKYALKIVPYPGLGCLDTLYTTIDAINSQFVFNVPDSIAVCPGSGTVDLTAASVTKGSSGNLAYTYYTDPEAQNFLPNPNAVAPGGTYYIKAVNPAGCSNIATVKVIVNKPTVVPKDPVAVTYPASIDLSTTFVHDPTYTYAYYKDPLATVPLANYEALHYGGIFYVKATSSLGCYTIKAITVTINPPPPPTINAPNTFTPNNDGVNDVFKTTITGYGLFKRLQIFDRYGELLFTADNINEAWDGTFKGKSVPVGTYYWIVEAVNTYFRTGIKESGSIALIR
jgi:gliding motility-associated-like protein